MWRIAVGRGLEAATSRRLAAEAGVSMGTVQHYFEAKERLILFACEYTVELAELGVRELTAASLDPDWEAVTLVSLLEGLVSHLTVGNYSGEEAPAAVDAHLDRLFG